MSEMIERVAKAMAECDQLGATADGPQIQRKSWRAYERMAHTAIAAMRGPTVAMIEGGKIEYAGESDGEDCNLTLHGYVAEQCFIAMIDAALED